MVHLSPLWQRLGIRQRCPPHLKGMSWLSHLYKTISHITRILAISSTNLLPRMLQDSTMCSHQSKNFLTAWEAKIADPHYTIFASVLQAVINKLLKYYNRFDMKPCILVNLGESSSLIFCSFSYQITQRSTLTSNLIGSNSTGAVPKNRDANGNLNARNWQDEARKGLEGLVYT